MFIHSFIRFGSTFISNSNAWFCPFRWIIDWSSTDSLIVRKCNNCRPIITLIGSDFTINEIESSTSSIVHHSSFRRITFVTSNPLLVGFRIIWILYASTNTLIHTWLNKLIGIEFENWIVIHYVWNTRQQQQTYDCTTHKMTTTLPRMHLFYK